MRRTFSGSIARHCDASTSRTCDVPMPNATAPNAPCVEVWLSPQAIVMPGCVRPSSGPMTCTMPCDAARQIEQPHARLAAVALERRQHVLGHDVEERPPLIAGRDDVIDGGDRALGESHRPAPRPQHVERLRRRDLVDQMQPDEELRLPVRQPPDRMRVPDLLEQSRWHGVETTIGAGLAVAVRGSGFGDSRVRGFASSGIATATFAACAGYADRADWSRDRVCGPDSAATAPFTLARRCERSRLSKLPAMAAEMGPGTYQSFRDLDAWKAAMDLVDDDLRASRRSFPRLNDSSSSAQMRRAAVSVPSNIAEGQAGGPGGRYRITSALRSDRSRNSTRSSRSPSSSLANLHEAGSRQRRLAPQLDAQLEATAAAASRPCIRLWCATSLSANGHASILLLDRIGSLSAIRRLVSAVTIRQSSIANSDRDRDPRIPAILRTASRSANANRDREPRRIMNSPHEFPRQAESRTARSRAAS